LLFSDLLLLSRPNDELNEKRPAVVLLFSQMDSPNDHEYSQDSCSDPPHVSNFLDQSLEPIQSLYLGIDSIGSEIDESSLAAPSTPTWFSDFVLYESDGFGSQANPESVLQTSRSAGMDLSSDIATVPLFTSSPRPVR
jgi:hypothetical protein